MEKNKNNIELKINGNAIDLVRECNLKNGKNNIKMIIKNKITNLS